MNKIVVYTAIFNDYDWLKDPYIVSKNVDYICFTDNKNLKSEVWMIRVVDMDGLSPALMNRRIKILYPYSILSNYDYSLYIDGSIMIKADVADFLNQYLPLKPKLINFKHPSNNCIYEEMNRCVSRGLNKDILEQQRKEYEKCGMPKQFGLSDNKIILRDNHSLEGKQLMEEWFYEVIKYSGRDQTCLSYVLFKHNLLYCYFKENIEDNKFFETWPHNNAGWIRRSWRKTKWMCERNHIGGHLIRFVNKKIKPMILKSYLRN